MPWTLLFKLFKFGFSQAKKHKANKNAPQQDQQQPPQQDPNMRLPSAYFSTNSARNPIKTLLETIFRFFQFILGLTVIGLYAQDISTSGTPAAKWVYAVVTAFLATISAMVYLILPFVLKDRPLNVRQATHLPLFAWECVLCILWLTLFGIFGKMYIGDYDGGDKTKRMRHAVWVDLVNLVLWCATGFWAVLRWWKGAQTGEEEGEGEGAKDVEKGEA